MIAAVDAAVALSVFMYVQWCLFVVLECSNPICHGHLLPLVAEIFSS